MNLPLALPAWTACFSALRLDRWMMGELDPADAESIRIHLATCAGCTAVAGMRGCGRGTPPAGPRRPARPLEAPCRLGAVGLALAATLVLVLRPGPSQAHQGHPLGLSMCQQAARCGARAEMRWLRNAVRFAWAPRWPPTWRCSACPSGRAFASPTVGGRWPPAPGGAPLGTRLTDATAGRSGCRPFATPRCRSSHAARAEWGGDALAARCRSGGLVKR
jgi:hypothetical protein